MKHNLFLISRLLRVIIPMLPAVLMTSCLSGSGVPCEDVAIQVRIAIHHDMAWTDTAYYPEGYGARSGLAATPCRARYILHAYPKGAATGACRTFEFYSDDLSLADFTATLRLPIGDWDIYVWQDMVDDGDEPYYDAADFAAISYIRPYRGDTDHRDCFRGAISVNIPPSALADGTVDAGTLTLCRPTAKYVFIADDYDEFLKQTAGQNPAGFAVTALYATFMPSVFDNLTDRVSDSEPGIRYSGNIVPLGGGRAAIAMDYVFMNQGDSGVQIQLALRAPDGRLTYLTDMITVPLRRARITYVEGAFLTSRGSSGINIDFGFDGDINIKI